MFRLILSLAFLAATPLVRAQNPSATPAPATPSAIPLFKATMPGGSYTVAVRNIISVSSHEYLVDAAARVTEVNIDTTGSILVRFYYIEPATPNLPSGLGAAAVEKAQQLFQQGADKAGVDAWKKVVKNYPTTTHARTVEYRLGTKEDVEKVYKAAEESLRMQKDKQVKVE